MKKDFLILCIMLALLGQMIGFELPDHGNPSDILEADAS